MSERVTRNQLAEMWGVGRSRIDNMVSAGQLPVGKDKRIDLAMANAVRSQQDPARVEQKRNAKIDQAGAPADGMDEAAGADPQSVPNTLNRARTAEAVFRARTTETNYKRLIGALVERDKVRTEAHNAGRVLMQRLLAVPVRVAPMVAPISDPAECRSLLEQEMRAIIQEINDALAAI